ncbi:MAG: ABC transporter permease subunit [Thioclava marina]|jgi:ABC-type dipeptide/oligopeptide/nickel transport systems, permease components|uniref:Dipeptide ABC transporter permease DppC n=1 Tax=Thioclava marina TaxID=1915077 RepID=A0ABX3MMH5_9RHOB|nr:MULTISPECIES: ABC transporter permease subunit [Thioclava]TNE83316.1 MAG: ABC transporter permease subunit [Paracoccaceae bacterium]MBC7145775.1 ABC transporter permease subunit [Thioclava marina]MBD3804218.1 ABC transporter permease subunit [Thioclava sp.]OOY12745.1 dipeptide ABC transporter permease DppC [Thioclava marina]OOY27968.1 dipeptide ABC transporter permease DppC [Thioclava sp. L04-15]
MSEVTETNIPAGTRREQLAEFWFYFKENRGAVVGLTVFILVVLAATFAPLLSSFSPDVQYRDVLLAPPMTDSAHGHFWLGTDAVGRDMLSRLLFGARYSLFVGVVVVLLALSVGVVLGLLAGWFGGWVDTVIMRVMDVILAFPSLLLALVFVAILGPGLINAMIAIAIVYQPHFARLTRGAVLSERNKDYVMAARVAGAGNMRLMFRTVLPNCLAPLIVQGTLSFSNAILDVAALGFLGLGAQPPTPEWGTMLSEAREFILRAWWVVTFPGLAILITVLAINLMGDGLRDALDPKLKRS